MRGRWRAQTDPGSATPGSQGCAGGIDPTGSRRAALRPSARRGARSWPSERCRPREIGWRLRRADQARQNPTHSPSYPELGAEPEFEGYIKSGRDHIRCCSRRPGPANRVASDRADGAVQGRPGRQPQTWGWGCIACRVVPEDRPGSR